MRYTMQKPSRMKEEGSTYVHPDKLLILFSKKLFESKNCLTQASLIVTKCDHVSMCTSTECRDAWG